MPISQRGIVLLCCLYFVCHGKRLTASFDRTATQQVISRVQVEQVDESHRGKFLPLRVFSRLPASVASGQYNSKHAFPSSLKRPPKAMPLGKNSIWHRTRLSSNRPALQSSLGSSPKVVPLLRRGSAWRHPPAWMNAVLERQRAPPAPPKGPPSDDGDGDGDGDQLNLREITQAEAAQISTDWLAKTRIYEMTRIFGNEALAEQHAAQIEVLQRFMYDNPNQTFWALEESSPDPDKAKTLALANVSFNDDGGLAIHGVCLNPVEVNDPDSKALPRLFLALKILAEGLGWDDDGDDGDGNGNVVQLREITQAEAVNISTDWLANTRAHSMTGTFGNEALAEQRADQIDVFEGFLTANPDQTFWALREFSSDSDKVTTLALAIVSVNDDGLVAKVGINPVELNDPSSTALERMSFALRILAQHGVEE